MKIKLNKSYLLVGVITIALMTLSIFLIGTDSNWIRFNVAYLGILICICGTLYSMIVQLDKVSTLQKQKQETSIFFKLLNLFTRQQEKLRESDFSFSTILTDIKNEIGSTLEKESYEFLCSNKQQLLALLSAMKKEIEAYVSMKELDLGAESKIELGKIKNKEIKFSQYIDSDSSFLTDPLFYELAYLFDRSIEIESDAKEFGQDFDSFVESSLVEYIRTSFTDFYLVDNSQLEFSDYLKKEIEQFMNKLIKRELVDLSEQERIEFTHLVFERFYKTINQYLQLLGLLLRYINKDELYLESKKNYLEILKANLTEEEMLVLFYYSAYTFKGEELFDEFKKTGFFLKQQGNDLSSLFSKSDLLWKEEDLAIMEEREEHLVEESEKIKVNKSMWSIICNLFLRK